MFKKLIAAILIFSQTAFAGLPPTTSKVIGDATNITTFNYQFPFFAGTHTGTSVSLGILGAQGGGTGFGTFVVGDMLYASTTSAWSKLAIGTNGQCLTSNGTTPLWGSCSSGSASSVNMSSEISNLTLVASVASNFLTVAVKTKAGADPSGGDPVYIGFRNATSATGDYSQVSITGALSISTDSADDTFGLMNGVNQFIYVYLINNAGTAELGLSSNGLIDEGSVLTTVAISGSANVPKTVYTTTARSNKAIRLVGRVRVNEATSGVYATAPNQIAVMPFPRSFPRSTQQPQVFAFNWVESGSVCSSFDEVGGQISSAVFVSAGKCNFVFGDVGTGIFATDPVCTCSVSDTAGACSQPGGPAAKDGIVVSVGASNRQASVTCVGYMN